MSEGEQMAEAVQQHKILNLQFETSNAEYTAAAQKLTEKLGLTAMVQGHGAKGIELQNKYFGMMIQTLQRFSEDTIELANGLSEELRELLAE